jgi:hypothetical protein
MHEMKFEYDDRGYGVLVLVEDGTILQSVPARTGSIGSEGLQNAIDPCAEWRLQSPPELCARGEYGLMHIANNDGFGWKWRLYRKNGGQWMYTRYLIHPDGSRGNMRDLNGTGGCIGLQRNAVSLFSFGMNHFCADGADIPVKAAKKEA